MAMEIILGKTAGFCGGVLNSVTKAQKYVLENDKVYCLGELVHNQQVVDKLKAEGLVFINSLDEVEDGSKVIIRAHGVPKDVYDKAKKRNIELYDLTCPKVLKIHNEAINYVNDGYYIVLIAHKDHPEVLGTISFCGSDSFIVEKLEDINNCIESIKKSLKKKVAILAQTTYSVDLFHEISELIKNKLGNNYDILINNTICNATELRQKEVKEMAEDVEAMIIIGGKNSSNTQKLFNISFEKCPNSYLIETVDELNENIGKFKKVGVMAGASTPKESIDEVIDYLNRF